MKATLPLYSFMGIILVLESEVACVLPGEQPHIYHQMNINTVTPMPCNITNAQCTITNNPSTEDSEGYTKYLQSHNTQFNNIMNSYNENPDNNDSDSQAKEVDDMFVQENPSLHLEMNHDDDLEPH